MFHNNLRPARFGSTKSSVLGLLPMIDWVLVWSIVTALAIAGAALYVLLILISIFKP